MQSNEIRHHGVKGMKWGVRRTNAQLGRPLSVKKKPSLLSKAITSAKKRHAKGKAVREAAERAKVEERRKSSPKSMTYEELKDAVNRLDLEKRYNQMMAERNPPKLAKTKAFIGSMLTESAKQAGTAWLTKEMKKALGLDSGGPKKVKLKGKP